MKNQNKEHEIENEWRLGLGRGQVGIPGRYLYLERKYISYIYIHIYIQSIPLSQCWCLKL